MKPLPNECLFQQPETWAATSEVVNRLASVGTVAHFPAHATVITEGETGNAFYVILGGKVKVFTSGPDGKSIIINTLGPGEYIGELALDGGPRSASVMTLEPTSVAVVPCADLRNFIAAHPDFALHLIHNLIGRLRRLTNGFKSLALQDVYTRVVELLNQMSEPAGEYRVIPNPLTQQNVAEHVGSSREMVSRIFKDLKKGGHIKIQARRITLLNKLPAAW